MARSITQAEEKEKDDGLISVPLQLQVGKHAALRLIRVLEYLKAFRGLPKMILVDNGQELLSHKLYAGAKTIK